MQKTISGARSALLVVVFVTGLMTLLYLIFALTSQTTDHYFQMGAYLFLTALYVVLYAWARKQPYAAILTGLCVFVGLWTLDIAAAMIYDPASALKGVFGRIVITFFLAHGFLAAKRLRKQAATRVR